METKKIALFGVTTPIGKCILDEALSRGHEVTAIVPDINKVDTEHRNLKVVEGNIQDIEDVTAEVEGHDIVINAESPDHSNVHTFVLTTRSLIDGVKDAGVKRVLAVGAAPEIKPGVQPVTVTPAPKDWKIESEAHRSALSLYLSEKDLQWSYSHPASFLEAGRKADKVEQKNTKVSEGPAAQTISFEDYAVALVDEAENNKHIQESFSVAF